MKGSIIILFSFLLLLSCSTSLEKYGKITLKNGEGQDVQVSYSLFDYEAFVKQISKEGFRSMANTASNEAKNLCKFPLTYVPTDLSFMVKNDTITSHVMFTAKNAYGVPDTEDDFSTFVGTRLIESY